MGASPVSPRGVLVDTSVIVLLVEDEALIASVLEDALEDGGFAVMVAHSGQAALDAIDEASDTLAGVITDIRLGVGLNGWEVARHARELNPTIPVVYMTGDSIHDHGSLGVPDSVVLQKPFAPAQLITAIATLINQAPPRTDGH